MVVTYEVVDYDVDDMVVNSLIPQVDEEVDDDVVNNANSN